MQRTWRGLSLPSSLLQDLVKWLLEQRTASNTISKRTSSPARMRCPVTLKKSQYQLVTGWSWIPPFQKELLPLWNEQWTGLTVNLNNPHHKTSMNSQNWCRIYKNTLQLPLLCSQPASPQLPVSHWRP